MTRRLSTSATSRRWVAAGLLVLVAVLVSACAPSGPAYRHGAARAIDNLLELRVQGSRDASAYADYFVSPELATALVEGTTAATGTAAVPEWEPPYVSAVGTGTVDVMVKWTASDKFPDWPDATVFVMSQSGGHWRVTDAVEPEKPLPGPVDEALLEGK